MKGHFKYVIVPAHGANWAILFPECVNHCDADLTMTEIVGAGFCVIDGGMVSVNGFSISLNIDSKPEDAQVIRDTLAIMGLLPLTDDSIARNYGFPVDFIQELKLAGGTPAPLRKAQKITWLHSAVALADIRQMDAGERVAAENRALSLNGESEEVIITTHDVEAIITRRLEGIL